MIRWLCTLAAHAVGTATRPWRILLWYALHVYVAAWTIFLTSFCSILTAPFRILAAARKGSLLEEQVVELQAQIEEANEKQRQLEKRLVQATKDRQRIQEAFELAVMERNKCLEKLKDVMTREEELIAQNLQLEEAKKQLKAQVCRTSAGTQDLRKEYNVPRSRHLHHRLSSTRDVILLQGRGRAMASSLFSAALSLLVALIVWEAEDPCLPLVMALFTVVGMSLANVIHFLTKLEARHGFDAIALMSFNWFILGTLACPAFPYLARLLSASLLLETMLSRLFGASMLDDVSLTETM